MPQQPRLEFECDTTGCLNKMKSDVAAADPSEGSTLPFREVPCTNCGSVYHAVAIIVKESESGVYGAEPASEPVEEVEEPQPVEPESDSEDEQWEPVDHGGQDPVGSEGPGQGTTAELPPEENTAGSESTELDNGDQSTVQPEVEPKE